MCFKKPTAPVVTADPELARQKADALNNASAIRTADKQSRLDAMLSQLGGNMLRRSLLSGGGGGAGFAAPQGRSLFAASN